MAAETSTYSSKSPLELAIYSKDSSLVDQAIQDGADVNEQNSDGDAALHIAIFGNASIDILRTLLANGASLTITNGKGETPLQCLQPGSWDTILNLLKLEKYFDFRDSEGNTLLHMLMDDLGRDIWGIEKVLVSQARADNDELDFKEQEAMIDHFWEVVLIEIGNLNIDINAQNKSGSTPLHIAAINWAAPKHVTAMLTHIGNINYFLVDSNGNTFLHVYFDREKMRDDTDFDNKLLQGQLRYCPKPVLKKLLLCQNNKMDTPLHVFMKNMDNNANVFILQTFLEAGADVNLRNSAGETILHCLIRDLRETQFNISDRHHEVLMELEPDRICFLVRNGADINSKNKRGDSPLSLAFNLDSVSALLEMGADVKARNNFLQTPLLSHFDKLDVDLSVIRMLLDNGADVNAMDVHGSNVLHYVAWYLHYIAWYKQETDIVQLLKQRGVNVTPDNCGQLPCHVAYQTGSKELFDMLCSCDKNLHEQTEHFNFTQEMVELTELENTKSEQIETIITRFQHFLGHSISEYLRLPGLGPVIFEGEAKLLRSAVIELMTKISSAFSKTNDILYSSVMQSGSVGENTKIGLPDEFDFVFIFETLGKICYVDEQKSANDPGFAYLKLKEEFNATNYLEFFDKDGYLDTSLFRVKIEDAFSEILDKQDIFCHPNIIYVDDNFKAADCPTLAFSIRWIGCIYKDLKISIDLVPACQIKGWWPQNANIHKLACHKGMKEEGALLMLQTEFEETEPISKLRISAMKAEKNHMLALPQIAREAYIVSKILCNNRICPGLKLNPAEYEAKDMLTSYMLKTCMFQVFDAGKSRSGEEDNKPGTIETLHGFVLQIFRTLLQCVCEENMPSFVFPLQNIFTFCKDVFDLEAMEMEHQKCVLRSLFAKIIMMILGELEDFKNIDIKCLLDSPD